MKCLQNSKMERKILKLNFKNRELKFDKNWHFKDMQIP